MQNFKINGESVPKIEWKQTDGQTYELTDGGDCITSHANAVGNKKLSCRRENVRHPTAMPAETLSSAVQLYAKVAFEQA